MAGKKPAPVKASYMAVLTHAVSDMAEHGFDSAERVAMWQERLKQAAQQSLMTFSQMEQALKAGLASIYRRMVDQGGLLKVHPGVSRFTIQQLAPRMRAELDRRIMASANLIRLNRQQAIDKTLQRFSGWATSLPIGGSDTTNKREEKTRIKKSLGQLPFEERRVLIDQGHKLSASISNVVAQETGAIAVIWHSNWRQPNYDYREDHKERDEKVYLLRNSWALDKGLIKPGPAGYYEDVTGFAEEPFCSCHGTWIYNIRSLPADMITDRGREEQRKAREALNAA